MGKVRRRGLAKAVGPPDVELLDDVSPGRLHGAVITAWNGPPEIDLTTLFAAAPTDVSVSGGNRTATGPEAAASERSRTVLLSDGTEITFAGAGRKTAETV